VNLSRALSIDAELALQAATDKFSRRFRVMEQDISSGDSFTHLSFTRMNELWEKAKDLEKSVKPSS
jgi:uncharacterized protein YabN with tetrapyrrole methylase and pyrophosphatase domain